MAEVRPYPVQHVSPDYVIIELFGGDNNLSAFVEEDLREMMSGNSGNIAVLALTDLYRRPAQVLELSHTEAHGTRTQVVEELGEIDTGDPEVLATFVSRALATYGPGVRKAIGFWDHGSGVFDEFDPDETLLERNLTQLERNLTRIPRWRRNRSQSARRLFFSRSEVAANHRLRAMLHDDTNSGVLTNLEAGKMLQAAFQRAGFQGKVDLIFSDTCLNGMIEVVEQLRDFAHCIVGSEDLEPGDGWEYQHWLHLMSVSPPESADLWGRQAVEAFEAGYEGRESQYPCTLGAFRTDNQITNRFRDLVAAAQGTGEDGFWCLERARGRSQAFARKDTYDIKDFADNVIAIAQNETLKGAATALRQAFDEACVHSVALGSSVSKSHGLAFWFPSSRWIYEQDAETYQRLTFNNRTGWLEFLQQYR